MYTILANLVLTTHVIVFLFVVGGLILILVGNIASWTWVNSIAFRFLHLGAIMIVVAESWLGITCPLTTLENSLRVRAGSTGIGPSFIEYWFQRILFYEAPSWVFALAYTLFAMAVVWAWVKYPPSKSRRTNSDA